MYNFFLELICRQKHRILGGPRTHTQRSPLSIWDSRGEDAAKTKAMEKQKHPAAHNLASATCKNRHHRMGQQQQP